LPLELAEGETKIVKTRCGKAVFHNSVVSGEVCQIVVSYRPLGRICDVMPAPGSRPECHEAGPMNIVVNCMMGSEGRCVISDKVLDIIKSCIPVTGIMCKDDRIYVFTAIPYSDVSRYRIKGAIVREILVDP